MSDIVIKAENLGKKYIIGHQAERGSYTALRDVLMQNARTLWKKTKDLATGKPIIQGDTMEEVWALRDVSFEIRRGEAVGIIGRNGAGKSTLLKILSRITEPTTGRVTIKGRVASLLEVGTGFHPELTGRENIYLNGTILGMTRVEIKRKFDEIVAFAEVEKYMDTPVKRYSSGMYVRLAFAVAAHLEPEILVVDEVLAVGDAGFQKKCLGKMGQVTGEGRTVLLVSHNMAVIDSLCKRCMLLSEGKLILNGNTGQVISTYMTEMTSGANNAISDTVIHPNRLPKMTSVISQVSIQNEKGQYTTEFLQGERIILSVAYDSTNIKQPPAGCGFIIKTMTGTRVCDFNTYMGLQPPHKLPPGGVVRFIMRDPVFTPGKYLINIAIGSHQNHLVDSIESVVTFDVFSSDIYETGYILTSEDGVVAMRCDVSIASG